MTAAPYRPAFTVRWRDVDALGHMANTAYLDVCVDVRFGFFAAHGAAGAELLAARVGPVVRLDEVEYFRELRFQDAYEVDFELDGMSDDGSHFRLRNRFYRATGERAAEVRSTGGWLDLERRRLIAAPPAILDALLALPRTRSFETLESSLREEPDPT